MAYFKVISSMHSTITHELFNMSSIPTLNNECILKNFYYYQYSFSTFNYHSSIKSS